MFEIIKKTLLAGVGAAVLTKEKAEVALQDFVEQGKVSAADAKVMARKIADQGKQEYKNVSNEIESKLRSYTSQPDAQSQARIAELEARLAALEKKRRPAAKKTTVAKKTARPSSAKRKIA